MTRTYSHTGLAALTLLAVLGCDKRQEADDMHTSPLNPKADEVQATGSPAPDGPELAGKEPEKSEVLKAEAELEKSEVLKAEAELEAADNQKVEGEIKLTDRGHGVEISVDIEGATPGKHGFHIHEKGDCTDIAGKSMGGHFNPELAEHMLPAEGEKRHLGDLGNIELGTDSEVETKLTVKGATLKPGKANSILGKAIVLHAGEDLGKTNQPAGGSGTPIACGVIKAG